MSSQRSTDGPPSATPPRFTTAEDVNPPLPGDPGYEDHVDRRAAWWRWLDEQRAEDPGTEVTSTPYYDAGLGRMVTPQDPAPSTPLRTDGTGSVDSVPEATSLNRTDAGNGEHFARLYGDRVRFDHRRRRWLVWAAHWWRDDTTEQVRQLAKAAARVRYQRALDIDDLEDRKREAGFAIRSEDRARLEAMLTAARTEPPIADAGDRWDADAWLLGVEDGVVELRTGRLRSGQPDDRMTLHTDIAYDPDAPCSCWERFLGEIFEGDEALIDYVRRAIGYSLTGSITEQCVFTCWGAGSNGKSVFLAVLRALAGGYAANTPFATLELSSRPSIPNDIAALAGRRIVTASEVNEGTRLNEARLKALTGGDPVKARFLHGEFFSYEPVMKLWLAVNHKPLVRDDSYGFWRRVRLIPFTRSFATDADPALLDTLRTELPGILARAVRGAFDWQRDGLVPPAAVSTATEQYRAESDPLGEFLDTSCVLGPGLEARALPLYRAYRAWATEVGLREREVLSNRAFGDSLTARLEKVKRNQGAFYLGIGLRAEPEVTGR